MSYYLRVLKDNPCGFWTLDGGSGKDYSSGYRNSSGVRTFNTATLSSVTTTRITPLVSGSTNAARMPSGSSITIPNNYGVFNAGTENRDFSVEFFLSFSSVPSSTTILTIGSDKTMTISDNTIKLKIGSVTAYYNVKSYESQLHIVIVYSKRSLYFFVNGDKSNIASIPTTESLTNSTNFVFSGSSSIPIIDSIAFYNYVISLNQVISHMSMSTYINDPIKHSVAFGGSIYRPNIDGGIINNKIKFNANNSFSQGSLKNLILDNGSIKTKKIAPVTVYNPRTKFQQAATYANLGGSYGYYSGSNSFNSIAIPEFNKYFSPQSQTITCSVYFTTGNANFAFMSIVGFNFGDLVLEKKASQNKIRLYSPTDTSIDVETGVLTSGWKDVRISFFGNKVTLVVSGTTYSCTSSKFCQILPNNPVAYLGNYYSFSTGSIVPSSLPSTNAIKYFSIFDNNDERLSNSAIGNFTLKLDQNLNVSQYGRWSVVIPIGRIRSIISVQNSSIVSSKIDWDQSSNNIKIYLSSDGSSFTEITKSGTQIPMSLLSANGGKLYARVTMETSDSEMSQLSLSELSLTTYSSMSEHFSNGAYTIEPYDNNYTNNTYQIRSNNLTVLSRNWNPGINFYRSGGARPGIARINPNGETYRTVEFWFRINAATTDSENDIWSDSNADKHVYYNSSLALYTHPLSGSPWTAQYLNGQSFSNGSVTLVVGEMYHFLGVLPVDYTEPFALNSRYNYTTPSYDSDTTIFDLALYPDAKNAAFALQRYGMYLGNNYTTVSDYNTGFTTDKSSVFVGNWN